jgi:hypothetical protein
MPRGRTPTWPVSPAPKPPTPRQRFAALKWSSAERVIARRGFQRALQQELAEVMRQAKKIARKDRATVRPVGVGTLSNRAPERNRPSVRLPLFRPPRRLRPSDPDRAPPRTRLTRTDGRKAPTHPPHGSGWASICRIRQIARQAKSSAPGPIRPWQRRSERTLRNPDRPDVTSGN